jgi:hypothetical protein
MQEGKRVAERWPKLSARTIYANLQDAEILDRQRDGL